LLKSYSWPGNVRELENAIERAVIVARDRVITVEDLPEQIRGLEREPAAQRTVEIEIGTSMDEVEKRIILETLAHMGGDKTKTAQTLGIGRKTLYRKLEQYQAKEKSQ